MSVQWIRRDHRLDMILATCLEAAAALLMRAKSARQLEEAVSYNLRLWRRIRALVLERPHLAEYENLLDIADHVAALLAVDACPCVDPRDMAFVAGRNMALASDLIQSQSPEQARDAQVAEWAASESRCGYESWIMQRLDVISTPAAATEVPFGE